MSRSQLYALIATIAGLVAVAAGVLTPLLPVSTVTATITWPQGQQLSGATPSVTSPLVAQTARDLDIRIPCRLLAQTPADSSTVVLATMPPTAPRAKPLGLVVTAGAERVEVSIRNQIPARAARTDLGKCTELQIWANSTNSGARFVGLTPVGLTDPAAQPQVAGLFTALTTAQVTGAHGLAVRIVVDNRFDSSPSLIKLLVMIIGILAAIVALVAVWMLDRIHGYHRRFTRSVSRTRALIPTPTDGVVGFVLVAWHFLGGGTADDGYILNMGRDAQNTGVLANYYRYYGSPEAPFDWYYSFLSHWSQISTAGVWMRLPALAAGLLSWLLLSRILLPRLGRTVRHSRWAMLTGAAVFLAFWLPMCSGLRAEPIIVAGTLLTWWAVEVSVVSRRVLPAALAGLAALATLAAAPQGVIALALLFTGARPMIRTLVRRRGEAGLLPLVAPMAGALAAVVIIVFRDQTLATVAEAVRIRYAVGPTLAWYQELLRYYFLLVPSADGSLVRRAPVLLLITALLVILAIMLRRKRITGVDSAVVWRLVGATLITILLLSFVPTKWTIQFGVFAGFGTALAALACVAVEQAARRTVRNFSLFAAALLVVCAIVAAGRNAWPWPWYFGIPWYDKAPVLAGKQISTAILVLAAAALLIALWQHLRIDYVDDAGLGHDKGAEPARWKVAVASSPIAVIAVVVVLAQLAVFAKAAVAREDTFSIFGTNVSALAGNTCGMADDVLVEPDPNKGMLTPVGTRDVSAALSGEGVGGESVGFDPNGVADELHAKGEIQRQGAMHASGDLTTGLVSYGVNPGTTGGTGPVGINGSTAKLPFGLDPSTTPVLGSADATGAARLTTGMYRLPKNRSAGNPLIVISAAGAIATPDRDGVVSNGQSLTVEFGKPENGKFVQVGRPAPLIDVMRAKGPWRNLRLPLDRVPRGATVLRLVAKDNNLDTAQWLAVTPPRLAQLKTLHEVVGSEDPALIDFPVGAVFACQRPMSSNDGVSEIPKWRILPDTTTAGLQSRTWMSVNGGGPLAVVETLTTPTSLATYLNNDWYQDWGDLQRLDPLDDSAVPAKVSTGTESTWGWSRPGAIRVVADDE